MTTFQTNNNKMVIRLQHCLGLLAFGLCLVNFGGTSKVSDFEKRQEEIFARISHLLNTNETYRDQYMKWLATQDEEPLHEFPCEILPPSPEVPTSVHKLRPADVKVVAAIGDSLSAGRGVDRGVIGLLYDFRGKAWSIGGDSDYSKFRSLPNILKLYNPKVYGSSHGIGDKESKRVFNAAITGDTSGDTLAQVKWLVDHMKGDKNIDFENDWKVITFFIGGNDLCDFCDDQAKYSVEAYQSNVQAALDYLQENVPRALVNLVDVIHAEFVKDISANLLCDAVHLYACKCAAYPTAEQEKEVIALRSGYSKALHKLASGRYDTKDDFTVVLQPFYENTYPPKLESGKIDMSFFASDCFHYSRKGQQAAAKALWNNMIEPVGSKRLDWRPHEPTECPTEKNPYFFTNKNSANTEGFQKN